LPRAEAARSGPRSQRGGQRAEVAARRAADRRRCAAGSGPGSQRGGQRAEVAARRAGDAGR